MSKPDLLADRTEDPVLFERVGRHIAIVTLNRPAALNTVNAAIAQAPAYPAPLTPSRFATQLRGATDLLRKAARWWIARSATVREQTAPNQIAAPNPVPTCRVVKFDDLRGCFPEAHPRVDAATRRAQLAVRRAHFAQRFQR